MRPPVTNCAIRATPIRTRIGMRSPIHPVRVRKAAQSTHIVPAELERLGFEFRYDFVRSLRHWMEVAPEDFTPGLPVNR